MDFDAKCRIRIDSGFYFIMRDTLQTIGTL
jgi:hypothetical protein